LQRIPIQERPYWRAKAEEYGFRFHTMYGEYYWDERAFYQFSLQQIEDDIEGPTEEIHKMCLEVVDAVLRDEELLRRFQIPEDRWNFIRDSWKRSDPSLYSRLDLGYHGKGPAKLYENNADTPTSIYETGFWQWLWLEDNLGTGVSKSADQFNSLQDKLIERMRELKLLVPGRQLHFSSCKDTEEDRGTVQYLEDCAAEAGITSKFAYVEDIGRDDLGQFTDLDDQVIDWIFKLYPWEFMFQSEYAEYLGRQDVMWLEPPWKSIISNKALLPLLWKMFPNHPNLLPAFFEDEIFGYTGDLVKKPIFSREGANVTIYNGSNVISSEGPYGEEGYIYQATYLLPKFGDNYTVIGSWLIDGQSAGMGIREDKGPITKDMSRFLPHVII